MHITERYCRRDISIERREGEKTRIVGYGAVFYREDDPGTEYKLWSTGYERIMPHAFDRAIAEDDVRSLFNHDPNIVLGRLHAGTLEISTDAIGLRYEIYPPDTQLVRDQVIAPLERGDVSGSSFMFVPIEEVWHSEKRGGIDVDIRSIHDVELRELGPVVFPAYDSTTANVRSSDIIAAKESMERWRNDREAIQVRARAVEVDILEANC